MKQTITLYNVSLKDIKCATYSSLFENLFSKLDAWLRKHATWCFANYLRSPTRAQPQQSSYGKLSNKQTQNKAINNSKKQLQEYNLANIIRV